MKTLVFLAGLSVLAAAELVTRNTPIADNHDLCDGFEDENACGDALRLCLKDLENADVDDGESVMRCVREKVPTGAWYGSKSICQGYEDEEGCDYMVRVCRLSRKKGETPEEGTEESDLRLCVAQHMGL